MANPHRGEVSASVGGKAYVLRPTFDALCELEEQMDKPLAVILAGVEQGRVSGLRSVIWCLLQDRHAKEFPTLKHASQWIEDLGGADVAVELVQRVFSANSEPEAQTSADPPVAQVGTGEPSSVTLVASA